MKANELRIGNLVKYEGKVYAIDSISTEFPTLNTMEFGIGVVDWNNIEPVTLTEEWLVKFGFEKVDYQYVKFVHEEESDFIGVLHDIGFAFYVNKDDERPLIYIRYVHELQNLYYCLCGKEL